MASSAMGALDLSNSESASTWLLAFTSLARAKKWKDVTEPAEGEVVSLEITDNFIAACGLEALRKVQYIVKPRMLSEMAFIDIKKNLEAYLKPMGRIVVAERSKFFLLSQKKDEMIVDFVARLRKESEFCEFHKLKKVIDPQEDMILMALVAGLKNAVVKTRVLEKMQTATMSVPEVQEFVQQCEEIKLFVDGQPMALLVNDEL